MNEQHIDPDPLFQDVFTLEEAAAYLDMPVPTLKDQVHRYKRLRGTVKARVLLFSRAQLDAFRALPPLPIGRPSHERGRR